MLGPLLFVYRGGYSKFFCFTKKNFVTVKQIQKKPFSQNFFFTEHEFEKCCEAKKMHKDHITGRRKNVNKKKSKLKVWHSYWKNILNHTSETQKSVFFNFVFWEVFLYARHRESFWHRKYFFGLWIDPWKF